MRGSSSGTERPAGPWRALLVAAVVLLGACGAENRNQRFEIRDLQADWASGRMDIRLQQRLELGPEAREALLHGVPLTLGVEVVLRDARTQTRLKKKRSLYEIRYLPLSEHYQLTRSETGVAQTFPRLRHALAELGELQLSMETGVLPEGEYELLARSFLDKRRVPPPMRLPVLFSPRWNHESAWTTRRLDIGPET
jgi:hypothetical protein